MAKIILTHEVSGLGAAGDVVEVKNGYARNYLVPQGYAVAWSRGGERQIEQIRAGRAARELASLEEAQALKAKLEAATVTVQVKAGAEGRLFGSIRGPQIADAVAAQGLGTIDGRKVEFPTAVKSTGAHEATVRLRDGIVATLKLEVVAA